MAVAVATRARRRWCEAPAPHCGPDRCGDPSRTLLAAAQCRCAPAPSLCLFLLPAPWIPDVQFQSDCCTAAQPIYQLPGTSAAIRGPDAHTQMGCPRRSLEVPFPIPCLELDVDRRRCVDPVEAPKLEPVFGLRHCPLPVALKSEEHPFPAPSSSLGCCRIQSGSCKQSWGQALAGAGMNQL